MNMNFVFITEAGINNAFPLHLHNEDTQNESPYGRQEFPYDHQSPSFYAHENETSNSRQLRGAEADHQHTIDINNQTSPENVPTNLMAHHHDGEDLTLNDQQVDAHQLMAQPTLVPEVEAKLYLRRKLGYFIASGVFSSVLLLMINGTISERRVFSFLYFYFTCLILENIIRARNRQREIWRRNEDSLSIIWLVSLKISLLLIDQRIAELSTNSTIAVVPLFVYCVLYIIRSQAPKIIKVRKTLFNLALTLQVLFITLKLDHAIAWSWNVVFIVSFLFLLVVSVYLALFTSHLLVMVLLEYFPLYEQLPNLNLRVQAVGVVWRLLFNAMGIFAFVGLLGVNTANTSKDYEYLHFAAKWSLVLNVIIVLYTIWKYNKLAEYLKIFGLSGIVSVNLDDAHDLQSQNRVLQFKTEKTETYFMMATSTYFLPLNNDVLNKNIQKVQRIKDIITGLTPKSNTCSNKYQHMENEGNDFIDVAMLRESEEMANNKEISVTHNKVDSDNKSNIPSMVLEDLEANQGKPGLSTNDTDAMTASNPGSKPELEEEEHLCYVCCINHSNAVLMDCGHGGICYQCAIFSMQKKNHCLECRGKVEAIYKINPRVKGSDIVKGVEVTKIVEVNAN